MSSPVFVVSGGGAVNLIDVPTNPHAIERFEQAIAKGDLRIVDASEVVEVGTTETGLTYRLAAELAAAESRQEKAAAAESEPQPPAGSPSTDPNPGTPNAAPPPEPALGDTGAGTTPAPVVEKPGKSASVEAWRTYAIAQGMDPDAAAAATKAALVEQFKD